MAWIHFGGEEAWAVVPRHPFPAVCPLEAQEMLLEYLFSTQVTSTGLVVSASHRPPLSSLSLPFIGDRLAPREPSVLMSACAGMVLPHQTSRKDGKRLSCILTNHPRPVGFTCRPHAAHFVFSELECCWESEIHACVCHVRGAKIKFANSS